MLGLLLIYFIGKQFSNLALTYNKSKWGYAILGVVVYYAGVFIGGTIIGFTMPNLIMDETPGNTLLISLMALPIGIIADVILYYALKSVWAKNYVDPYSEIDTLGEHQEVLPTQNGVPQKLG